MSGKDREVEEIQCASSGFGPGSTCWVEGAPIVMRITNTLHIPPGSLVPPGAQGFAYPKKEIKHGTSIYPGCVCSKDIFTHPPGENSVVCGIFSGRKYL